MRVLYIITEDKMVRNARRVAQKIPSSIWRVRHREQMTWRLMVSRPAAVSTPAASDHVPNDVHYGILDCAMMAPILGAPASVIERRRHL